jgi:hypothetical protein
MQEALYIDPRHAGDGLGTGGAGGCRFATTGVKKPNEANGRRDAHVHGSRVCVS